MSRRMRSLAFVAPLGVLVAASAWAVSLLTLDDGATTRFNITDKGMVQVTADPAAPSALTVVGGDVGLGTTSPSSQLEVGGPIATALVNTTAASYTVGGNDSVVAADASTGPATLTLPSAVGIRGRRYSFKKVDGSSNAVTVATNGGETVDGATTYLLSTQYAFLEVVSDGANWLVVSSGAAASGGSGNWVFESPGSNLNNGLVAYWKLDETSGSRVESKNGHDLSQSGVVGSNPGIRGNAAQIVRSGSEYLTRPDHADLTMGDIDFTIAAWAYLDTTGTHQVLLGKRNGGGTNKEYQLDYYGPAGRFRFKLGSGATDYTISANVFGAPSAGTWYLVIGWHDATNDTMNIQVNTTADPPTGHGAGVNDTAAPPLLLGARESNLDRFNGRLDEIGIWKRVLSAQERSDLYNGGAGNTYTP